MIKDYGAICIAAAMAGAVYMFLREWLNDSLFDDHFDTVFTGDVFPDLTCAHLYNEINRIWGSEYLLKRSGEI